MVFNQEGAFRRNPVEARSKEKQDKFLEMAKKNLDAHRIDMRGFVPLYTTAGVLSDARYVNQKEATAKEELLRMQPAERERILEAKNLSTLCEWAIFYNIHVKKVLGESVHGKVTTAYDDWKNGVDQIYQFKEDAGSSYLGLGIDITFSGQLHKKFGRIQDDIRAGSLSRIKYFEDVDHSFKGELSNVPRVIVGFDNKRINRIAHLWSEGNDKSPDESFIHDGLLYEISLQLEQFEQFARKVGKKEIAEIYERNGMLVKRVMEQSKLQVTPHELDEDRVFHAIRENLSQFK